MTSGPQRTVNDVPGTYNHVPLWAWPDPSWLIQVV